MRRPSRSELAQLLASTMLLVALGAEAADPVDAPSGGVTVVTPNDGPSRIVSGPPPVPEWRVIVNGKRIGAAELERIEQTYRVQIRPAEYWYDRKTGPGSANPPPAVSRGPIPSESLRDE